jgi:alpha-mannosidase
MGHHTFAYALLPHALTPQLSAVWWSAAQFNIPLTIVPGLPVFDLKSFVLVDAPNVVLDTIKIAEDNNDLIMRVYEAAGSQTIFSLKPKFEYSSAFECDLLERDLEPMEESSAPIQLSIKPFEIKSLRFCLK